MPIETTSSVARLFYTPFDPTRQLDLWHGALMPMIHKSAIRAFQTGTGQSADYIGKVLKESGNLAARGFDKIIVVPKFATVKQAKYNTLGRIISALVFRRKEHFHDYTQGVRLVNYLLRQVLTSKKIALCDHLVGDQFVYGGIETMEKAEADLLYKILWMRRATAEAFSLLSRSQPGSFICIPLKIIPDEGETGVRKLQPAEILANLKEGEFGMPLYVVASWLWLKLQVPEVSDQIWEPGAGFSLRMDCMGDVYNEAATKVIRDTDQGNATQVTWDTYKAILGPLRLRQCWLDARRAICPVIGCLPFKVS